MLYRILADLVVAIHVAYVSFVVVGLVLIWLGIWRRWDWVRNRAFRMAHLAAITIVALEAIFEIPCPLTIWEDRLRQLAGEDVSQGTFIGRWLHRLIFYDAPSWVFTVVYLCFALAVAATLVLAPPRWRKLGNRPTG